MDQSDPNTRLSGIPTLWSDVHQAQLSGCLAPDARRKLLQIYGGAVWRYLLAALRNEDAAEELFQEFAVLFLRGGLRGADPGRGRFRDYLKGTLFHLIADHHNKARHHSLPLDTDRVEPAVEPDSEQDEAFLTSWRDELLARAWVALQEVDNTTGQIFYVVLRYRADHPRASSTEMADGLSLAVGKKLTAPGVRQTLHRARDRFADLLLDEIAHALAEPTVETLEEELIEIGLLEQCRPALDRRRESVE
jgi:RNA polymerase sigma-70 factor (ECF subfamily)